VTPHIISILVLGLMFVIATIKPINMGLLGFVAAFLVGAFVADLNVSIIVGGLPIDLFVTLLGITLIFAIAQGNGAVDRMVGGIMRALGGNAAALPWAMFLIAAVLTGVGALSPAAVAILAPLAVSFGVRNGVNPLLMGLMVIHGAQAGGFSPLSVYGGITRDVVQKAGLAWEPMAPFYGSLIMNLLAAIGLFIVMGRRDAIAQSNGSGAGEGETVAAPPALQRDRLQHWSTYAALIVLAVLTLIYKMQIGLVAMSLALILTLIWTPTNKDALRRLPWPEIVLIIGVGTYVAVLEKMGTINYVGDQVAGFSTPAIAGLLLLLIAAVVSAFASSAAVLGSLIPLAVPFLQGQPPLAVSAFVAAMSVAATIVDVSPFSTNGALVLANSPPAEREKFYRRLLMYGALVVVAAPLVLWISVLWRR
jgi:di/tricarboxylate transporter